MPLVLLLHGFGDSGQGVEDYIQLRPLAEARGFLYCYPDAMVTRWGPRAWNATDHSSDAAADWGAPIVDDAGYLRGLIEEICRRFVVDGKRIHVMGRSAGGGMAYRMACQCADLVAGISSHAGTTFFDPSLCAPTEPVNILHLHGTADTGGPYWGGANGIAEGLPCNQVPYPGAVRNVETWAGYNGAHDPVTDPTPTLDLVLDVAGLDTVITRYTTAPPGGAVELWTINGSVHRPPLSTEFSPRVIDWLLAHPKP
jgi:polyhydroxybutyrate depolymerase